MEQMRTNLQAELEQLWRDHNDAYSDMEENFRRDLEDLILQKIRWSERRGMELKNE